MKTYIYFKLSIYFIVCTVLNTKSSKQMFIATLYEIAKNWKLAIYLSIGEFINKLSYIHAIHYKSSIKKLLFHATWINLKIIMLSEKSQRKGGYTAWFHLYKYPVNANL